MTDVSDCKQLHGALRSGQPLSAELLSHAKICDPCGELLADDAQLARGLLAVEGSEPFDDAALSRMRGVLGQESSGLAPLRSLSTPVRITIATAVAAVLIGFVALRSLRPDIDVYPRLRLYATVATYLALAAALLRLGLWRLDRALPPRPVEWALFALGIVVPLAFAWQPQAHLAHAASLGGVGADLVPRAAGCFLYGTGLGLVIGGAAYALTRAPRSWRPSFLILGSGVLGAGCLELHCALTAPLHLAVGHATVAVVASLVALGLGSRQQRATNP